MLRSIYVVIFEQSIKYIYATKPLTRRARNTDLNLPPRKRIQGQARVDKANSSTTQLSVKPCGWQKHNGVTILTRGSAITKLSQRSLKGAVRIT